MLLQSGAANGSSFILSKAHTTKLGGADTFVALLLCPIYKILHNKHTKAYELPQLRPVRIFFKLVKYLEG